MHFLVLMLALAPKATVALVLSLANNFLVLDANATHLVHLNPRGGSAERLPVDHHKPRAVLLLEHVVAAHVAVGERLRRPGVEDLVELCKQRR